MRLPIKWKLFHFANYVQLFSFLLLFGLVLKTLSDQKMLAEFVLLSVLFCTGLFLIIVNYVLNLYIIYKYFPNRTFQGKTATFYFIATIIHLLLLAGFLLLCLFALNEELNADTGDNTGMIMLFILFTLFLTGLFILIMQFQVKKFLEAGQKKSIDTLIENIGSK